MELIINRKLIISKLLQFSLYPICIACYFYILYLETSYIITDSFVLVTGSAFAAFSLVYYLLLFKCKRNLIAFNLFISLLIVASSFLIPLFDFSKINVIIWTAFTVFSYYTSWSLIEFLNLPVFNPKYFKSNLHTPSEQKMKFYLNGKRLVLTNWNEDQAYFYAEMKPNDEISLLNGLIVKSSGQEYKFPMELVTQSRSNDGFGVIFTNKDENMFRWIDLVDNLSSSGIESSKLR